MLPDANQDNPCHSSPPPARQPRIAGLLLLIMALLSLWLEVSALSGQAAEWMRAFAHAALVGGIADWFAVTALFRHPIGIPLPHTALIPRRKDRLASGFSQFFSDYFLRPLGGSGSSRSGSGIPIDPLKEHVRKALDGLSSPSAQGILARVLGTIFRSAIHFLLHSGTGKGTLRSVLVYLMSRGRVAPYLADGLECALVGSRSRELVSDILRMAAAMAPKVRPSLMSLLVELSPRVLPAPLSRVLAGKMLDRFELTLTEMSLDELHPTREPLRALLNRIILTLREDHALGEALEKLRSNLLTNSKVSDYSDLILTRIGEHLEAHVLGSSDLVERTITEMINDTRGLLRNNPRHEEECVEWITDTIRMLLSHHSAAIELSIKSSMQTWDSATLVQRIEQHVARDLQYLRINGTIVGGLAGLLLHFCLTVI
jgi:uncharacterized membrane-anchored protein YjiN (DUF445 family)